MHRNPDFVIIAQSECVNYSQYSKLPIDRLPLFQHLVYPRMVRYEGMFLSHLDLLNRLLGNPSFRNPDLEKRAKLFNIWNLPSFSGIHLANYLFNEGITTYVVNNFDVDWYHFKNKYILHDRFLIGVSTTFYLNWVEIKRIVSVIKRQMPSADIVLGGAFIYEQKRTVGTEALARLMLKYGIKYALHAVNSEEDLKNLILWHNNGAKNSPPVSNLIMTDVRDGSFFGTKEEWHKPQVDCPAHYHELDFHFLNKTIQIRASAGCCFHCAFCTYPIIARGYYPCSLENLKIQLDSLSKTGKIRNIIFIDDTLNVPLARFKDFLRLLLQYNFSWFSFLRVQFVDNEAVELMARSGCQAVYLGIESASDSILQNMNKKATRSDYIKGVRLLRDYGIHVMAAFIVGFPGETAKSIAESIDFICTSGIDFYTLKEFFLIEGTDIDKQRATYDLRGLHNNWEHNTMSSVEAYEHKIAMFKQIGNECLFVDADTSLWSLAYLFDQGFNFDQIATIQKNTNRIINDQINGDFDDHHPSFDNIRNILKIKSGSKCQQ